MIKLFDMIKDINAHFTMVYLIHKNKKFVEKEDHSNNNNYIYIFLLLHNIPWMSLVH